MAKAGLDALPLTTEPVVRYFTGFLTRFWESPTRPWFLVVPRVGDPVAVIPAIGATLMQTTGLQEIRTWRSPDYHDDGVFLLSATLCDHVSERGVIGVPSGAETHLRMPLDDWDGLQRRTKGRAFHGDGGVMRRLWMVKSVAEIAKIAAACAAADRAFALVPEIARPACRSRRCSAISSGFASKRGLTGCPIWLVVRRPAARPTLSPQRRSGP